MTEIEVPTEHLHEEMNHLAEHSGGWISRVALSSAILAALAAVAALLAGHHANEAMMDQIHASDSWSYYQAKGIKASVLSTKMAVSESLGKKSDGQDAEKLEEYKKEQSEISEQAKEKETAAQHHLHTHEIFARGVTMFQIAIAVSAISALTRRKRYWFVSLAFGAIGLVSFVHGLISSSS